MERFGGWKVRAVTVAAVSLASGVAFAFAPVPRESAEVLKVTRGRSFSSGAVFINGKYVEPPYVIERWGTGIRINGEPVTGQVVDWNEFLKTQAGARAVKQDPSASAAAETSSAATEDVDASSLDDLFDDDPKPKKQPKAGKRAAPKPKPTVTYTLEGDFVPNETTKALLARINAVRTEIDRTLRVGGFVCFGDEYSRVTGDSRTLTDMLSKLPEIQRNSQDVQDFCQKVRAANMVYLNEVLRWDLFRNRLDYRKLQERREKLKKANEYQKVLDEVSAPLF